jgi:hypothetical protein
LGIVTKVVVLSARQGNKNFPFFYHLKHTTFVCNDCINLISIAMTRREEFETIYEYLQGKLTNNPKYEFHAKRKDRERIKDFLENEIVGNLWNYLTFQFNRQVFLLSVSKLSIVPLPNVIGKAAIERWRKRTQKDMWFTSKFVMEYDLRNPIQKEEVLSDSYLDKERRLYFDTPRGYILCESYDGFLYHDEKCKGCRYIKLCEEKYKG